MYQLRNTLLGLRKSVRWKSSAGAVSLSPSFAVIYFNFLGQQLASLLQRQPEVFVHLLQPS